MSPTPLGLKKTHFYAALVWLFLTLAIGVWWVYFSYQQIGVVDRLVGDSGALAAKHQRMILSEGVVLLTLIVLGGAMIVGLLSRANKKLFEKKVLVSAIAHDLKTTLTSIGLRLESLNQGSGFEDMQKLQNETHRLKLQMENILYYAQDEEAELWFEEFQLLDILAPMRSSFSELQISVDSQKSFWGDKQAVEIIFSNLFHNANHHGGADKIQITTDKNTICVQNSGRPIDPKKLEQINKNSLLRPQGDGTGMGLYISQILMKKMNGDLRINSSAKGVQVWLEFPDHQKALS